jgi:hypothetical protein
MLDHSVVKAFPIEDINGKVLAIGAIHVRGFDTNRETVIFENAKRRVRIPVKHGNIHITVPPREFPAHGVQGIAACNVANQVVSGEAVRQIVYQSQVLSRRQVLQHGDSVKPRLGPPEYPPRGNANDLEQEPLLDCLS